MEFGDIANVDLNLNTSEEVMIAAKNAEIVSQVEHAVSLWCKNIEKELALCKQMRKDTDDMDTLDELAYWRNLTAKLSYIIQQVQGWKVVSFIQVLVHSKSRVLRVMPIKKT